MGALGAGLALPFFSCLVQAGPVEDRLAAERSSYPAALVAASDDSALSRWHSYALASITPQFSWALRPQELSAPRVLDSYSGTVSRPPIFKAPGASATQVTLSVASATVADTPSVLPERTRLLGMPQSGLQRTVVAPTLARDWGDHGSVRLTGVLAYQRFASLGLGVDGVNQWTPLPGWMRDSSYGVGMRIEAGNAINERLRWNVGYQSRVSMGAFNNYRGVFADAGHFDIPASASASLSYALTPQFSMDVGAQRVMYSAIKPFTSSGLPTRFLALLGDSSSPAFAWRDLTVYSAGWTLHDTPAGTFDLRYTTRQQPIPTSRLLERALAGSVADNTVSLGWSRKFGLNSYLGFSASYASSPYFLLMPTYTSPRDSTAGQLEFEALWSVRF